MGPPRCGVGSLQSFPIHVQEKSLEATRQEGTCANPGQRGVHWCEARDRTLPVNSDLSLHRVDFPYALCCFGPAQPTCVHHSEICGPMFCFSQGPGKACLKESFDLTWRQSSASSSGISRDVRHIDCVAEIIRADLFCAPCCEKNSSKNREACVHCVRSGTWYEPCTELLHITSSQIPPWLYSCLFPGGGLVTFEEKPCYPAKHGSCG